MLNSGNPRIPGPATDTRCRYLEPTCPTRGHLIVSSLPFASIFSSFHLYCCSNVNWERAVRIEEDEIWEGWRRDRGIEIRGIFHPVWSLRGPSRSLHSSAVCRVTGFFGRKGSPRFYPDPFENFERMMPRRGLFTYIRVFKLAFYRALFSKKAEPTNAFAKRYHRFLFRIRIIRMEIECVLLEIFLRVLFFYALYTRHFYLCTLEFTLCHNFSGEKLFISSHRVSKIYHMLLGFLQTII